MKLDPKKQSSFTKKFDKKPTPSNTSVSFSGEKSKVSLDEDTETSVIQNESEQNKTPSKGMVGSTVRRIRTYKEDVAEAVRAQKASLTSITAAEQERRGRIPKDIIKKRSIDFKKIGIISASVLLVLLGVVVIGFFVFFYEKEDVVVEQDIPSFVFTEEQKRIDITGKNSREILQSLQAERESASLSLGQITHLYITESTKDLEVDVVRIISAREFLERIRTQVSGAFLRSLNSSFMLGIHVSNQNQPFIILKSNSYQNSFKGLLEWERTIYNDLFLFTGRKVDPILKIPINPRTGNEVILRENFEDRIIKNIDVRVLANEEGGIEFLYAFPNQQTIIITTNENTLVELITRLNSVRIF